MIYISSKNYISSIYSLFLTKKRIEINLTSTKSNDKTNSNPISMAKNEHVSICIQCNAASAAGSEGKSPLCSNHASMETTTRYLIAPSRPSSPSFHHDSNSRNLNKANFSAAAYYQTYNDYLKPTTFLVARNSRLKMSGSGKKKLIKIQDGTTWLSLSGEQKNGFYPVKNGSAASLRGGSSVVANSVLSSTTKQSQFYLTDENASYVVSDSNRINVLLKRKNSRANT